jgi:hypothetical protein
MSRAEADKTEVTLAASLAGKALAPRAVIPCFS